MEEPYHILQQCDLKYSHTNCCSYNSLDAEYSAGNVSQLLEIGCLVPDITDHRRTAMSLQATPALLLEFRVKAEEHFPKQTETFETFTVTVDVSASAML